jgi:hypothetical protein
MNTKTQRMVLVLTAVAAGLFLTFGVGWVISQVVVSAAPLDVMVSELAWGGMVVNSADEWVELYNNTGVDIDLTGWQELSDGGQVPIETSFKRISEREVEFEIGMYNHLFIEPNLTWNTFLGGTSSDQGYGIALDESGNVFVAGVSNATWGSPVRAHAGGQSDAFVAKLDSSGNLIWNTFLGGGGQDVGYGHAIAVDVSGNAYVVGYSDSTWGLPVNAYAGDYDAFVAKVDSNGNLTWNTFLGSSDQSNLNKGDIGRAIAVDGSGNVYVTGYSWDTWGSPICAYTSDRRDAFAAKLDGSGNLTWNTFLGSGGDDFGYGIAVDESGNSYVAGEGCGSWGSPMRAYAGWCDGFAAKLDGSGQLTWNTFLGGGGECLCGRI